MENEKNSLILEESSISYYSPLSNYGIKSNSRKIPINLFKSFSPLSSNKGISFSNTIMFPFVTASLNTNKNITRFKQEKSKTTFIKESTALKTEFSKDEETNINDEKEVIKILINKDENSRNIEESNYKINKLDIDNKNKKKSILEKNPFFQGGKSNLTSKELLSENNRKNIKTIYN